MADVEIVKTSPEKTLEAADNFDMPPPCIPSTLQEKAKTDNEGLKRTSSMTEKKERTPELPFKVPSWSGVPEDLYSLEVLKNGCIISNIDLTSKPFHVFGRLPNCDVSLEHPSVSRYHAVIQYKTSDSSNSEKGFYIYDLGSTHGTTVNKSRIEPKRYYRLRVGYVFKFGGSSRLFILQVRKYTHWKKLIWNESYFELRIKIIMKVYRILRSGMNHISGWKRTWKISGFTGNRTLNIECGHCKGDQGSLPGQAWNFAGSFSTA